MLSQFPMFYLFYNIFDEDGTAETQLLQFARTGYRIATNLNNFKRVEALLCPLSDIIEFLRLFC